MREKINVPSESIALRSWGKITAAGLLGVPILVGALGMRDELQSRQERRPIEYAGHLLRVCAPAIANESGIDVSSNQAPDVRHAFVVGRVIERQLSGGHEPVHDFTPDELARATRILRDRLKLELTLNSADTDRTRELLDGVNQEFEESCAREGSK